MTVACSTEDAKRLQTGRVEVVPHAVVAAASETHVEENPHLVGFLGSGRIGPNREAVDFIGSDLLEHPGLELIRCRVIGEEDGYGAHDIERMEFLGFCKDLSKALAPVSVCCAPMQETGGVSTKVLAYLINGKRTVSTMEAASGIVAPPDGLWIAERPQFAEVLARALVTPWLPPNAQALREWMANHHGLTAVREAWRQALTRGADNRKTQGPSESHSGINGHF
jgi:hypothetical protein